MNQQHQVGLARWLPILDWGRRYNGKWLGEDLLAAVIVALMLIPQALAYAMLAGLPPVVGLYASLVPLVVYTLLGTSTTLSVGPMAVVSLMTASALSQVAESGSQDYIAAALVLALLSGGILLIMGLCRLGFLVNFLSHPVMTGFVSASGVLIAASQLKQLLGVDLSGSTLPALVAQLPSVLEDVSLPTMSIGLGSLLVLWWVRRWGKSALERCKVPARVAGVLVKLAPIATIVLATLVAGAAGWLGNGVAVIGEIPAGLPPLTLPDWEPALWRSLIGSAVLISIVGYVESVSVAQALAVRRGERVDPDQELIGLGGANLAASFTGGMPITGGFSRSVVNFDAGARTPASSAFTAVGIALAMLFLSPWLRQLPMGTLAATIVIATVSLVDLAAFKRVWRYARGEGIAMSATALATLMLGVDVGILVGVAMSLALHLYGTSRPHSAEVGRIPGTEHFRNVRRHAVETDVSVAILRVDESLYFANVRHLEDLITAVVNRDPPPRDLVLACQAINVIDATALESLEALNRRLRDRRIGLHLAEVKGPVMDRLSRTELLETLNGRVFLSTFDAWCELHGRGAGRLSHPCIASPGPGHSATAG
ncbi:sulfate permease [Chromohalobacter sp. TMW 2.2308]|uniref:Sulfate permease n=1 Tax=Chromohalobacter moromii TaxID=2860329 RepID=A0A9X2X0Y5_9GAMM|nr:MULTISPECIES: sulfate permease [Chromohalobacter]MCK2042859.1 sulfate permease [Chromohalobacter moromii]MCK2045249.1 sulfate permease [Chromohalobacter moromii]MCT8505084.1 sulfate permease [Chromohalobacter moromii]MCT8514621.1 sulfate permease [Chromohalobacter sp. TMW 2.2271]